MRPYLINFSYDIFNLDEILLANIAEFQKLASQMAGDLSSVYQFGEHGCHIYTDKKLLFFYRLVIF